MTGTALTPGGRLDVAPIWSVLSPQFGTGNPLVAEQGNLNGNFGVWWSANKPLAIPFVVAEAITVHQLGWWNTSFLTDNIDVGIYDAAWARKVSAGSTARSGSFLEQWVDTANTTLTRGRYWLAMSTNGTTANVINRASALVTARYMQMMGCKDSATDAFPLPDPLTNMVDAASATYVPSLMFSTRALV